MYRDSRAKAAGGRTPWRKPQSEPLTVVSVTGNKVVLRRSDGTIISEAHIEDTILVPHDTRDLERQPLVFDEADDDAVPSPGEMMEASARGPGVPSGASPPAQGAAVGRGKLEKVTVGGFVAYTAVPRVKNCLLYTSPSPRDKRQSRMPSSA